MNELLDIKDIAGYTREYLEWKKISLDDIKGGQINVDRSCSVIWSIVGAVCPAWSSGVDNACSPQYFDSLFAHSLLGCFEMLSSGRSIFQYSS
jgi:hypothetical protein